MLGVFGEALEGSLLSSDSGTQVFRAALRGESVRRDCTPALMPKMHMIFRDSPTEPGDPRSSLLR